MTTKVEIWNLALRHVRAATVGHPDELTVNAMTCKQFYDLCKGMALSEEPWGFATRWQVLPQMDPGATHWLAAYQLPAGFLRLWGVRRPQEPGLASLPSHDFPAMPAESDYEILYDPATQQQVMYCNIDSAEALVTTTVDEAQMPPLFVSALSHLLAGHIAVTLAGVELGTKLQARQNELYTLAMTSAASQDASHRSLSRGTSKYITARR